MRVSALNSFICPIDGSLLVKESPSLRCAKGHVYDVAREGYCNLLLVQQKSSLDPGDSKDMVAARHSFLNEGHFFPIAEQLFKIISRLTKDHTALRIVDAGCGEGYYLHQLSLKAAASQQRTEFMLAGCDISKWAIKIASKRTKTIAWAVAGNRRLPFAPNSADIILSMFGFPVWESFKAIQPIHGRVILVDPGPDHLNELREIIYPKVKASGAPNLDEAIECRYELDDTQRLRFSIFLESQSSIQDLLLMTPHAFRITKEARKKLQDIDKLQVTVDVLIKILEMK